MKLRLFTISMVAVAVLGGINSAQAADGKDFSATIGLKVWNAWWQTGFIDTAAGNYSNQVTSNGTPALIPSLTVKYKDYFINGSYFNATNFGFPTFTYFAPAAVTVTSSAKRTETDINVGWYFVPQVAVTLGYKEVKQDYTFVGTAGTFTTKYKTPTIGVSGSAKIGDSGAFMYGNGVHGLSVKVSGNGIAGMNVGGGKYSSSELGFGWAFAQGVTATLGYKYQTISAFYDGVRGNDITSGFIGGVNYTF